MREGPEGNPPFGVKVCGRRESWLLGSSQKLQISPGIPAPSLAASPRASDAREPGRWLAAWGASQAVPLPPKPPARPSVAHLPAADTMILDESLTVSLLALVIDPTCSPGPPYVGWPSVDVPMVQHLPGRRNCGKSCSQTGEKAGCGWVIPGRKAGNIHPGPALARPQRRLVAEQAGLPGILDCRSGRQGEKEDATLSSIAAALDPHLTAQLEDDATDDGET